MIPSSPSATVLLTASTSSAVPCIVMSSSAMIWQSSSRSSMECRHAFTGKLHWKEDSPPIAAQRLLRASTSCSSCFPAVMTVISHPPIRLLWTFVFLDTPRCRLRAEDDIYGKDKRIEGQERLNSMEPTISLSGVHTFLPHDENVSDGSWYSHTGGLVKWGLVTKPLNPDLCSISPVESNALKCMMVWCENENIFNYSFLPVNVE